MLCFVCARVASKLHERMCARVYHCGSSFSRDELCEMELALLKAMGWSITYASPVQVAAHVLSALRGGAEAWTTAGAPTPRLQHNVEVLLDAAFFDCTLLRYTPAEVAIGAVVLALKAERCSLRSLHSLMCRIGVQWPGTAARRCAKRLQVLLMLLPQIESPNPRFPEVKNSRSNGVDHIKQRVFLWWELRSWVW